jgi:hypothetical protein
MKFIPGTGSSVQTMEMDGGVKWSPVPNDWDPLVGCPFQNFLPWSLDDGQNKLVCWQVLLK